MIVWTNGCFDILHRGHIELFNQEDRKAMLESIKYIDKVFIFDSRQGLEDLIKETKPHVLIVGSDWKGKDVVGEEYAQHVRFFDRIDGYSTTEILEWKNQ